MSDLVIAERYAKRHAHLRSYTPRDLAVTDINVAEWINLIEELSRAEQDRDIATLAIKDAWEALEWAQKGVCPKYRFPEDLLTKAIVLHKKYIAQEQDNKALLEENNKFMVCIEKQRLEKKALREQVERLSAPVSDREWSRADFEDGERFMQRYRIDALIASRKEGRQWLTDVVTVTKRM